MGKELKRQLLCHRKFIIPCFTINSIHAIFIIIYFLS